MEGVREAPVFRPSAEEFADPLRYIESVRAEAEAAGICKIVPPAGWRPPFAVDTRQFRFHTRVQNATLVDGVARVERDFMLRLRKYLFTRGAPMNADPLPTLPATTGRPLPIRLYRLFQAVQARGGAVHMMTQSTEAWEEVVEALLGQPTSSSGTTATTTTADTGGGGTPATDVEMRENANSSSNNNARSSLGPAGASLGRMAVATKHRLAEAVRSTYERYLLGFELELCPQRPAAEAIRSASSGTADVKANPALLPSSPLREELEHTQAGPALSLVAQLGCPRWEDFSDHANGPEANAGGEEDRLAAMGQAEVERAACLGSAVGAHSCAVGRHAAAAADLAITAGREQAEQARNPKFTHEEVHVVHVSALSLNKDPASGVAEPAAKRRRRGRPSNKELQTRRAVQGAQSLYVRRRRLAGLFGKREQPQVVVGATFYKYYRDLDRCYLGRVHPLDPDTDTYTVEYMDLDPASTQVTHTENVNEENLVMLLASGETEQLAREAMIEGICQECLRADHGEDLLLCDGCNFAYHTYCLDTPLRSIPPGDWFCSVCLEPDDDDSDSEDSDAATDAGSSSREKPSVDMEEDPGKDAVSTAHKRLRPKLALTCAPLSSAGVDPLSALPPDARRSLSAFGFGDGEEYSIDEYRDMANAFKARYIEKARKANNPHVLTVLAKQGTEEADLALEREYWRLVSDAARHDPEVMDLKVSYGSDLDTGKVGSGFPSERDLDRLRRKIDSIREKMSNLPSATKRRSLSSRESLQNWTAKSLETLNQLQAQLEAFERYTKDGWNLNIFPRLPGSLLQFVDEDITGVIVPWLYMGMFFSSFCWHTEDHYFASINYHHWGEPKTWYGVPSSGATAFESAARDLTPELFAARPDILTGIVTQFNPTELAKRNVPVYHIVQRPGEFVLTFPQAYHGGFNHGLNCAEAVNFATARWIPYGESCVQRYTSLCKNPVISHYAFLGALASYCCRNLDRTDEAKHIIPVARQVFPVFQELLRRETAARNRLRSVVGSRLKEVEFKKEYHERLAAHASSGMKRGRMPQMTRMGASVAYGRERAHHHHSQGGKGHNSTDSDEGWVVQVQCEVCRRFCSLAFVEISHRLLPTDQGEPTPGAASADSSSSRNVLLEFLCLDHGAAAEEEFLKANEDPADRQVRLVTVWELGRLESLKNEIGALMVGVASWRSIVAATLLEGQPVPSKVGPPRDATEHYADRLAEIDANDGSDPPRDGLPPGVLYTVNQYVQGDSTADTAVVEQLLALSKRLSVNQSSREILALQQVNDGLRNKFAALKQCLATRAADSNSWPRVEEIAPLLNLETALGKNNLLVELHERLQAAECWAAKVKTLLEKTTQERFDGDLERAAALQREIQESVRLRVGDWLERLEARMKAMTWHSTVLTMLSQGTEVEAAQMQVANAGLGTVWERTAYLALEHQINLANLWVTHADTAHAEGNLQALVPLVQAGTGLIVRPTKRFAELTAVVLQLQQWEQRVATEMNAVEHQGGRHKEADLTTLQQEGSALGLTETVSPGMRRISAKFAALEKWRLDFVELSFSVVKQATEGFTVASQHDWLPLLEHVTSLIHPSLLTEAAEGSEGPCIEEIIGRHEPQEKLYCVCRQPEKKDVFMFGCDGCGEWFHPACLGTTEAVVSEIKHFLCGTCIVDGRRMTRSKSGRGRKEAKPCLCDSNVASSPLMVQCDDCLTWYHPLCVGMTDSVAADASTFVCPDCCQRQSKPPMIKLVCKCRKPVVDGVAAERVELIVCDHCATSYHPSCIGLESGVKFEQSRQARKYYCETCCRDNDVGYDPISGRSGYCGMRAIVTERNAATEAAFSAKIADQGLSLVWRRPWVEDLNALVHKLEAIGLDVPEERLLRKHIKAVVSWADVVASTPTCNLSTRTLWSSLAREATIPALVPREIVHGVQYELWVRYLLHAWFSSRTGAIETHPTSRLPTSAAYVTHVNLPFNAFATLKLGLHVPGFRKLADAEAGQQNTVRGFVVKAYLHDHDMFKVRSAWERRCRRALGKVENNTLRGEAARQALQNMLDEAVAIEVPKSSSLLPKLSSMLRGVSKGN